MNIYCTAWHKAEDVATLLKEWTGQEDAEWCGAHNLFFVMARDAETGKYVGTAQYIVVHDPFWKRRWALVENVFVTESYRGKGVGQKIMRFVEQQAFIFGCKFIKLTTRKELGRALYRSLGYEEGTAFYKQL